MVLPLAGAFGGEYLGGNLKLLEAAFSVSFYFLFETISKCVEKASAET